MEKLVLTFVGGCHVAGYLVGKSASFVDHLSGFFAPQQVHRLPYTKIEHLTRLIKPAHTTEAAFVFLQLGNFEFSASWKQILSTTAGLPGWGESVLGKSKPAADQSAAPQPAATPESSAESGAPNRSRTGGAWGSVAVNPVAEALKTTVGAGLYVVTWLLLRKHRQQFRALNQLIALNPQTTFVCMSPFPSTAGTHNLLRRLGGWIMRQRLHNRPNLRWVDTHRVLRDKQRLFADGTHLNESGHRVLAQHLQSVCLTAKF